MENLILTITFHFVAAREQANRLTAVCERLLLPGRENPRWALSRSFYKGITSDK